MVRIVILAAALALSTSSTVAAQAAEPEPTRPPDQFKGVRTAVITSALTDPLLNTQIKAAATAAHRAIGGNVKKRLWTGTLPTPRSVATAARDLAELGNDIVLITGGDSQRTVGQAGLWPETHFLDIGQPFPCVTQDGIPDPSGGCGGGVNALPFNYSVVTFAVDEPAYLAGVVAASASRNDRLGIISGLRDCDECNRYIEGFTLGAQSVKPGIGIELTYLADDDVEAAFGDPIIGKTFAEAFINVHQPDVLFPVAGASTRGMIEAACDAGILAVGSEGDVSTLYPQLAECILTSIDKDLQGTIRESIFGVSNETIARSVLLDLDGGGVSITDEWKQRPGLLVDLPTRFDNAQLSIQSGLLDTCPTACSDRPELAPRAVGTPDPSAAPSDEPAAA